MHWRNFTFCFLVSAAASFLAMYLFIAWVDPLDFLTLIHHKPRRHINLIPTVEGGLMNDRYTMAGMGKRKQFDAALFGNSTAYILHPLLFQKELPQIEGMRMINLSMRAALPYEQYLTARHFLHYHPRPRLIVFTVGWNWCLGERETIADPGGPMQAKDIPVWLFSPNPFTAYAHIFSYQMLKDAMIQYHFMKGRIDIPPDTFERNGNSQDLDSNHIKPLDEILMNIYGPEGKRDVTPAHDDPATIATESRRRDFARPPLLGELLKDIPAETEVILIFMPEHHFVQPSPGSIREATLKACKSMFTEIIAAHAKSYAVDFLIDSTLTREDTLFYNGNHFSYALGNRMPGWVAQAIREQRSIPGVLDYIPLHGNTHLQ